MNKPNVDASVHQKELQWGKVEGAVVVICTWGVGRLKRFDSCEKVAVLFVGSYLREKCFLKFPCVRVNYFRHVISPSLEVLMFPTTGDMQEFMKLASKTLGIDAKRAFLNFGDTGHQPEVW